MPPERRDWVKAIRRSKTGGVFVFIDGDTLGWALDSAGIPKDTQDLKVRRYTARTKEKNVAKIVLNIREVKK